MRELITDEMVETAARAAYNSRSGGYNLWAHATRCEEEMYLEDARAALDAAAPLIAATARAETTTDLHWSNAAAAEYPGDEYEQYPLRRAFGRGVRWERKRAARKGIEQ